ncbi:type II secretion system protein GspK [Maricaulis maris]|uniref:type II secretion system protein GspK n=1 Tax=Maricaulis maris TaxID=74318 RepID=UPI0011C3951F|nr:type II secretion system protein GspK [Maricaulis maris]
MVFVLWMSLLLATILLAITSLTHTRLRLVAVEREGMVREAALRSALDIVAYDIALIGRSHVAALPVDVQIGEHIVRVEAGPGQRLLDLNMANNEQLTALFVRLGESQVTAETIADRILDWRDADDDERARGAERAAYAARPDDAPQNRPFMSVEELRHVLGMTPRHYACAAAYLTVVGGTPAPARDSAHFGPDTRIDGMRVSLRALVADSVGRSHEMVGLAEFETSPERPFLWVAFGEDQLQNLNCPSGEGS